MLWLYSSVTEFSKKTGDYRSLSAVDIRLMALAYQLEKEHVGVEHINTEPNQKVSVKLEYVCFFLLNYHIMCDFPYLSIINNYALNQTMMWRIS